MYWQEQQQQDGPCRYHCVNILQTGPDLFNSLTAGDTIREIGNIDKRRDLWFPMDVRYKRNRSFDDIIFPAKNTKKVFTIIGKLYCCSMNYSCGPYEYL